jgi:hypothetical protein
MGTGLLSGETTWIGAGHVSAGGGPDGPLAQPADRASAQMAPRRTNFVAMLDDMKRDLLEGDTDLAAEPATVR